jgi:ssDNA-binding replication factor A large subunit
MKGLRVEGLITHKSSLDGRSRSSAHALATIADETGEVLLNLWRDQLEQVETGDDVILKDAFSRNFKGKLELSLWGPIEKIQKSTRKGLR